MVGACNSSTTASTALSYVASGLHQGPIPLQAIPPPEAAADASSCLGPPHSRHPTAAHLRGHVHHNRTHIRITHPPLGSNPQQPCVKSTKQARSVSKSTPLTHSAVLSRGEPNKCHHPGATSSGPMHHPHPPTAHQSWGVCRSTTVPHPQVWCAEVACICTTIHVLVLA